MFFFSSLIGLLSSFFVPMRTLLVLLFAFAVILSIPMIIKEVVSYV